MIYVLRQWQSGNIHGICAHLVRNRVPYRVVEAWQVARLPPLKRGDAIVALGGPASVCGYSSERFDCDFLIRESIYLLQARVLRVPVLGICLSHQLLAAMRGNEVSSGALVFGVQAVETTPEGRAHWLFKGTSPTIWAFQHHRDAVRTVSQGAAMLARSATCAIEAVAWDDTTVSTQFHPEVLHEELTEVLSKYSSHLRRGQCVNDVVQRVPANYTAMTRRIFDNFLYRAGFISRPAWINGYWQLPRQKPPVTAPPRFSAAS